MCKFWKPGVQHEDSRVIYLKLAERFDLKCSHHTHTLVTIEVVDMLTSLIVVIISQCLYISKHHIIYLKHMQFLCVTYTSIKLDKKCNLNIRKIRLHIKYCIFDMWDSSNFWKHFHYF